MSAVIAYLMHIKTDVVLAVAACAACAAAAAAAAAGIKVLSSELVTGIVMTGCVVIVATVSVRKHCQYQRHSWIACCSMGVCCNARPPNPEDHRL